MASLGLLLEMELFSDATIANPVYTPGVNDLANMTVELTLTATGNNPCANVSHDMTLSITPSATAAQEMMLLLRWRHLCFEWYIN